MARLCQRVPLWHAAARNRIIFAHARIARQHRICVAVATQRARGNRIGCYDL